MKRSFSLTFSQNLFFLFSCASFLSLAAAEVLPSLAIHTLYAGALAGILLAGLILSFFSRRLKPSIIYALIFVLAISYASYKNAPFPYRYGERADLRLKLLSEERVRRGVLEFVARIKGVEGSAEGVTAGSGRTPRRLSERVSGLMSGEKILLHVPPTKASLRRGDTVRVSGLFLELPFERAEGYASYLKSSGINAIFEGYGKETSLVKRQRSYAPVAIAHELNRFVRMVNERLLPWPQSEFALSLFTGNRDDLPKELVDAFIRSGTMHLLAVSGLHFGFLTLFFVFLFKLFRLSAESISILLVAVTLFYMIFIGDAPSVQRSAIMVLCGIGVFLFDRDRNYYNILAISFDLLWCMNPLAPFNPGFLLSFSATFALFFLAPIITERLERFMPKFIAVSLSVSAAVQVYLWPVLLYYFGSFPYINLIANIPLVPLSGVSLGLELVYLIVYPVCLPLAIIVAEVNTVVVTVILRLTLFFGRVPPLAVNGFPGYLIPVFFLAVTAGVVVLKKKAALGGVDPRGAMSRAPGNLIIQD